MPAIPGAGGGGASITAGSTKITFPAPIEASKSPITINTPPAFYPQVMHDPSKNKPILIVPEIIYPKKKKRIIVHHNAPMMSYYQNMMFRRANPYYMQFAKMNKSWAPFLEGNDYFQQTLANEHYAKALAGMKEHFPEESKPSSSTSSMSSTTPSTTPSASSPVLMMLI